MKKLLYGVVLCAALSFFINNADSLAQNNLSVDTLKYIIDNVEKYCEKPCVKDTVIIKAYLDWGVLVQRNHPDSAIAIFKKSREIIENLSKTEDASNDKIILFIKEYDADLLEKISFVYDVRGDYANAIMYNKEAYLLRLELGNPFFIAENVFSYAAILYNKGDMKASLEEYKNCIDLFNKADDKAGMSDAYNSAGFVSENLGLYQQAFEYYFNSLKISIEINDKKAIANRYSNIGALYYVQGNIPLALDYIQRSYKINNEIGNKRGEVWLLNNLAYIYSESGNIAKAFEYHYKSMNLAKEIDFMQAVARSYNNLAYLYKNQGNTPKAMEYNQLSLSIKEEINDIRGTAISLNNIGLIYSDQGDNIKALDYILRSLNVYDRIGDKKRQAETLNNIGGIYSENAMKASAYAGWEFVDSILNLALFYHLKSLEIRKEINDVRGIATSYQNIGFANNAMASNLKTKSDDNNALQIANLLDESLNNYKKSLEIRQQVNDKKGLAESSYSVGQLYFQMNDTVQFRKFALESYKLAGELNFPQIIENASSLMTIRSILNNDLDSADIYVKNVVDIKNNSLMLNFSILPEAGKEKYFQNIEEKYMDFYSYAVYRKTTNPSITEEVYNNILKTKGLLLRSSTSMRNAILSSEDSLLIDNYYNWIHLKKQIINKISEGDDVMDLVASAEELEKELVQKSQIFNDYNKQQSITWKTIKEGLKPNEAAIEFVHFKYKNYENGDFLNFTDRVIYCALLITSESKHPEMIALFDEIQLEKLLSQKSGNNLQYVNAVYGTKNDVNIALYNLIWKPIESYLNGVKSVYISPSGLLHKISFTAIAKDKSVFLCDLYDVKIQSSTSRLIIEDSFELNRKSITSVFGGINYNRNNSASEIWKYLHGTKLEAESIAKLFSRKKLMANIYSGDIPTEKKIREIAPTSHILHIATHGFFYPDPIKQFEAFESKIETEEILFRGRSASSAYGMWLFVKNPNPLMRSGLIFSGANHYWMDNNAEIDNDGVLTAEEVINIDLRSVQLVVLSACETGLGDVKGSEGVYGLQRAFKMAGAKYLIMSLWQVPDKETVEFMEIFYAKLLDYKDVRKSFNETQREMRQKYDPFFWAAFVLIE